MTRQIFTIPLEGLKGFVGLQHLVPGIKEEILGEIVINPGVQVAQLAEDLAVDRNHLKTAIRLLSGRKSGQINHPDLWEVSDDQELRLRP